MKVWAGILIILAVFDVLTTYISLSVGNIEINPLFHGMRFEVAAVIKMAAYGAVAYTCFRLKLRGLLIFGVGLNVSSVLNNLMVIWATKYL